MICILRYVCPQAIISPREGRVNSLVTVVKGLFSPSAVKPSTQEAHAMEKPIMKTITFPWRAKNVWPVSKLNLFYERVFPCIKTGQTLSSNIRSNLFCIVRGKYKVKIDLTGIYLDLFEMSALITWSGLSKGILSRIVFVILISFCFKLWILFIEWG